MALKAFVFDLDGTLVNTLSDIADSVNLMLSRYSFPTHSEEEICKMIGNGAKMLISRAIPKSSLTPDFLEEALEYYRNLYDKNLIKKTYVYPELKEVLLTMKNRGIKMSVLSNKDDRHVKEIIKHLLPDIFEFYNGNSPKFPRKPSPNSTLDIMEKMGVSREETAFVGDSPVDVVTAENVGITSIGVSWGFCNPENLTPDILIKHPTELLELI